MGESDNNSIMFGVSWELGVEGLLLNAAASRQGASHEDKRLEEKTWPNILIVGDVGIFYSSLHSKVQVSNNTYLASCQAT